MNCTWSSASGGSRSWHSFCISFTTAQLGPTTTARLSGAAAPAAAPTAAVDAAPGAPAAAAIAVLTTGDATLSSSEIRLTARSASKQMCVRFPPVTASPDRSTRIGPARRHMRRLEWRGGTAGGPTSLPSPSLLIAGAADEPAIAARAIASRAVCSARDCRRAFATGLMFSSIGSIDTSIPTLSSASESERGCDHDIIAEVARRPPTKRNPQSPNG